MKSMKRELTARQLAKLAAQVDAEKARVATLVGRTVVKAEFEPTQEGCYTLTLDDGRVLEITAVGDDMTYCEFNIDGKGAGE